MLSALLSIHLHEKKLAALLALRPSIFRNPSGYSEKLTLVFKILKVALDNKAMFYEILKLSVAMGKHCNITTY